MLPATRMLHQAGSFERQSCRAAWPLRSNAAMQMEQSRIFGCSHRASLGDEREGF
jgi:hypothetical protein